MGAPLPLSGNTCNNQEHVAFRYMIPIVGMVNLVIFNKDFNVDPIALNTDIPHSTDTPPC